MNERLSELPSVDFILQTQRAVELISLYGRPVTLEAVRFALAEARRKLRHPAGDSHSQEYQAPTAEEILFDAERHAARWLKPSLVPVINATGVILHTNLGRAPVSRAAMRGGGSGRAELFQPGV